MKPNADDESLKSDKICEVKIEKSQGEKGQIKLNAIIKFEDDKGIVKTYSSGDSGEKLPPGMSIRWYESPIAKSSEKKCKYRSTEAPLSASLLERSR